MTSFAPTLTNDQPMVTGQRMPLGWVSQVLSHRWANHLVFWALVFVFNAAYIAFIGDDRDVSLYNFAWRIPFILACCYLNLYYLMPRFYYTGKLFSYAVLVLLTIFSLNALNLFLLESFVDTPLCPTTFEADATFNSSNYIYKGFYLVSIVGLTSGIKLSRNHFAEKQKADAIEKEKLQTELSLLKSQINPHFFFNTLNNLYALTLKKSDLAPDMVLKLSELMSYSLYESDGTHVSLEKELKHINNYIELETIRLGNKMNVEFITSGIDESKQIPPLIFLPIIENCFKHAAGKAPHNIITITLTAHAGCLQLQSKNPVNTTQKPLSKKGGLGLRNAQRRLHLLYGDRYRLETTLSDCTFTTILEIPVA